jgi:hypothetical protein
MNQLAITFVDRTTFARHLGTEAGERCRTKAEEVCPNFGERAYHFIVDYASTAGTATFSGEDLTLIMKGYGIRPHDDRAFGSVYAKAIRNGVIRVVGYVPRVRGNGTAGGRLYAAGHAG